MLSFLQGFFRLTLDNVYRFACSALFWLAVASQSEGNSPLDQLGSALEWLTIPSTWLGVVQSWIMARAFAVGAFAALAGAVAAVFAASTFFSRAGSTVLISVAVLIQVGRGQAMAAFVCWALVVLIVVTFGADRTAKWFQHASPEWPKTAWLKTATLATSCGFAALYFLSPLGWMVSQDDKLARGSQVNPLVVTHADSSSPAGALPPDRLRSVAPPPPQRWTAQPVSPTQAAQPSAIRASRTPASTPGDRP